jgi:hypothetical protein
MLRTRVANLKISFGFASAWDLSYDIPLSVVLFFSFHRLIFIYYFYIVYVLHNAHLHSMKISKYESYLINCITSDIIMLSILLSFKIYCVVVHSSLSNITLTVIVLLKFEYHENPIFLYIFCI